MNIFITNQCPVQSAVALPNVLVNKMLQESIQLMSTAHFELDGDVRGTKPTHKNHPSAIFTRACKQNYMWVLKHAEALLNEYTHRTGKTHGYTKYFDQVNFLPANIPVDGDTDFPMCMPDEFKKTFDVCKNYQLYLNNKFHNWTTRTDKKQMKAEWTNRDKPDWVVLLNLADVV